MGNRLGDGTRRGVLIVKVPGRRTAATVEAVKRVSMAKTEAARTVKAAAKAAAATPRPSRRGRGRPAAGAHTDLLAGEVGQLSLHTLWGEAASRVFA